MERKKGAVLSTLEKEYRSISDVVDRFKEEICQELTKLINDNNLRLGFPIQKRVKTWRSIQEKIINSKLTFASIEHLQDLIGLRAVFLYKRDVKKFEDIVSTNFVVKRQYDTSMRLEQDQFGYSSIHYVIQMPKAWLKVPTLSEFGNLSAELQIRTLSQHIWAEISHELQYKSEEDVPTDLIRPIYRASALLETVDLEFERLLLQREEYRKKIDHEAIQTLNVDTIENVLDSLLPDQNKHFNEDYALLHKELIEKGIKTTDDLKRFVEENLVYAIDYDKERVRSEIKNSDEEGCIACPPEDWHRIKKGYFFTHTGLVRAMLERKV